MVHFIFSNVYFLAIDRVKIHDEDDKGTRWGYLGPLFKITNGARGLLILGGVKSKD